MMVFWFRIGYVVDDSSSIVRNTACSNSVVVRGTADSSSDRRIQLAVMVFG